MENMENQLGSFSLTTDNLSFTPSNNVLKTVIKNLSLKSTSYDISIPDSDHFKLMSHRMFGLAPGMSKTLQIRHIEGEHCHIEEKQIRKMKVTNSYKRSHIIYCKCPCFLIKEPEKLIDYPETLRIGEFDHQKSIKFTIANICSKNMRLLFKNHEHFGVIISFCLKERILLENESIEIQLNVNKNEHGEFNEEVYFQVFEEGQEYDYGTKFKIRIRGNSVNRVLTVKDEKHQPLSDLKHQVLNGTSVSNYFYLQNKYTKPANFTIQTSIDVENPAEYARKWKNCSLIIGCPNGILQPLSEMKVEYTVYTHYNEDDENFVIKYSKIGSNDEISSLKLKNSSYAKKNIQINVSVNFYPMKQETKNPEDFYQRSEETFAGTKECSKKFKVKCLIVNPCLRFQLNNAEETTNRLVIYNQTKLIIPYNFSLHSLYRIKPMKGVLPNSKKEIFILKWNKDKEKCKIFLEIPEFDLLVYDIKELKDKKFIDRPATRRPHSCVKIGNNSFYRNNKFSCSTAYASRTELMRPLTPVSTQYFTKKIKNVQCGTIIREIPKFFQIDKIPIQQLDCLIISQDSTNIVNTHKSANIILQFIDVGFLVLAPNQRYFFDEKQLEKGINFRVYGHQYVYRLLCTKEDKKKFKLDQGILTSQENVFHNNQRNQQTYKILNRQLKMFFRQNKTEFQVIQSINIKNISNQPLHIYCITVDGEFFQSKEEDNHLVVEPNDTGKFRISFFPKNCIRLGMLKRQLPTDRRKAEIKNMMELQKIEGQKIRKDIELMIGKNIQKISCIGEFSQRKCETRPAFIAFTQCKYGSAECTETFLITNTSSSKKIHFMVQYPSEVVVRPKLGTIGEKSTLACTVSFKPFKKIQNYRENIRVYIRGSHMELIPLKIDVADPDIYIKEDEIIPLEQSIFGGQNQELYAQMSLVNNNPSQCHVELDLRDTQLFIGCVNNKSLTYDKGLVIEHFFRNSRIEEELTVEEGNEKEKEQRENTERKRMCQKCCTTVPQQSTLIIPLTLIPRTTEVGQNIIYLRKCIAKLMGFGPIRVPKIIKYEGKKTVLQITPSQQIHDIVLTKNQQIYQINLKNVSNKIIKVKTQLVQQKKNNEEPPMICTYKDIDDFIRPDTSIDLAMSFIAFDGERHALTSDYIFNVYVDENEEKSEIVPYISTKLNVSMPQPFLEISPTVLIMPTTTLNSWSRSSFTITNQGHKQIFIKIKKPANIAFDLQYQINSLEFNHNPSKLKNSPNYTKKENCYLENQLTRLRNCIEVKLNFRSKVRISFNIMIEIHDNFNNKYEMTVAGTATDCPIFQPQTVNNQLFQSAKCINNSNGSHGNISSFNSISSRGSKGREQLSPADIEDLLFLNNWLGIIIPELSNESIFFYVWMTKIENILKFLNEFNVNIQEEKKGNSKIVHNFSSLKDILEMLKKNGFLLNSLRVDRLEKGDQLEWLNFMWYFFSHQIICKESLVWISKMLKVQVPYTYETIQNNLNRILVDLIQNTVEKSVTKQISDWKTITEKYDPLFHLFTCMQSKRHMIMCLNLLFHKLKKVQRQTVLSTNLEFKLFIQNSHNRRVKYSLVCPNKKINIFQSSNKTLPTLTPGGYSFSLEENQTVQFSLLIKDTLFFKESSVSLYLFDNTLWNPISVYSVEIKQSETRVYDVIIECEEKCTQQWINRFQSKISSEYTVTLDGNSEFKCITPSQLGFLKKGDTINIKVEYSPQSMEAEEAVLQISCPFSKEIYKIKGKPLHSTAIQFQKIVRVYQGQKHQEMWVIPWQRKNTNSVSSRNDKSPVNRYEIINYGKILPEILSKSAEYTKIKQQMKLSFLFDIEKLYRNLQAVFKIQNQDQSQSKLIKLIIDVIPKPIIINAEIETQLHKPIYENLKIYPLAGIGENVSIEYCSIKSEKEILGKTKKVIEKYEANSSFNPFSVVGKVNSVSLLNSNAQVAEYKEISIKYYPIQILDEDPLFYLSLNYMESLYEIRYLFKGRMDKLKYAKPQQPRQIKHECIPLKKYKGTILLTNSHDFAIKYEVKTNLLEITGKQEISIQSRQTVEYSYDIYCLHLEDREGKILFTEKSMKKGTGSVEEFAIKLKILKQKNSDDHLRIYNQKVQIKSKIREERTLSITLANKSSKAISYDIKCNTCHLKTPPTVSISPNSEENIDFSYLPLFIGKKEATLEFFNPNQPEIKYNIQMSSQSHFQKLAESNENIAQYVTYKLTMFNPLDKQVSFKLAKCTNKILSRQEGLDMVSFNKTSLKAKSVNIIEAYVLCNEVQKTYSFDLVLTAEEIGDFNYEINYKYAKTQMMEIHPFHLEEDKVALGEIQFLNPFKKPILVNIEVSSEWKPFIELDVSKLKQPMKGCFEVKQLFKTCIPFTIKKAISSELKISVIEKKEKYTWIFPFQIYETYILDVKPVFFRGNADEKVAAKVYPRIVTSISNIKLQFKSEEPLHSEIEVAHETIRARNSFLDSNLQKHKYLKENQVYEVEVQMKTKASYSGEGYILLYQNQSSLKRAMELDSTKMIKDSQSINLHRVQIIPFIAQLAEPKAQIIDFVANVGQLAKVQIHLQNEKLKNKSFSPEEESFEISNDQITLYNNKSKQFSAALLKEQRIVEVTYHAREYSGLKFARLEIKRKGETSHFELRGKFPNKKK